MSAQKQVSSGFVVYREGESRKYLLLHHGGSYWNYPKGKLEEGETHLEAAYRELAEETGLSDVEVAVGFKHTIQYKFEGQSGEIDKTVVFFLARYRRGEVILSHEHQGYDWLDYDESIKRLRYRTSKYLLSEVEEFLNTE